MLAAPFPIARASYRRKLWRDITGQTGFQQRKAQLLAALGDPAWPGPAVARETIDALASGSPAAC